MSWIVTAVVCLLILGVVARWSARRDSKPGVIVFFLLIAWFPVWGAMILGLVAGALAGDASGLAAAPWFMMIGYFRYAVYAFVVAALTAVAYVVTRGDMARKLKVSFMCLTPLAVAAGAVAWTQGQRVTEARGDEARQWEAVIEFVRRSPELAAVLPGTWDIRASRMGTRRDPGLYLATVSPVNYSTVTSMQVLVEVSRTGTEAQFRVTCVAPDVFALEGWREPGFTCAPPPAR